MVQPKAYVEEIQQQIYDSRNTRLWVDSVHMLATISESIFSRSAHFILELLQNAEDAGSTQNTNLGKIEFRTSPDRVKVSHNGSPFTYSDVDAICGIRSNKKPEEGTLGYLGIGFKSVFKVSNRPEIHSGGFHFKFAKTAYTDPENQPWQIIPIWVDHSLESTEDALTTFILPFRSSDAYHQTLEELRKLDVHVFLFLRWLRKLTIIDEVSGQTKVIENLGERDNIITLKKDRDEPQCFAIFRRDSLVPEEVASDPALEFYKRQKVKQRQVVLAFGIDDSVNLKPIDDASALGSVASFLPLLEERSGAKFLIQADFLVQPGREAIQYELSWNRWLVSEAAEAAKEAINEFKKHPKWNRQFLSVFNFEPHWGQAPFEKLFRPCLHEPLISYLQSADIYPTSSGTHVKPELAVQPEGKLKELLDDADLPLIFFGETDLCLADPNLNIDMIPDEVLNCVKRVSFKQVVHNKPLLDSKTKAKGHIGWFIKLYSALAETDQSFKYDNWRDSRGRFRAYESPIYVLSVNGTIESANKVYLGPVPREVLQLRKQFPVVDGLLCSYKLIHPKLQSPRLEDFFEERTHVQRIDYDRICREVFLPKVVINSVPPPPSELIAYTRLLQKGPAVHDRIWVVTKGENIKPSEQTFLGAGYSPSENWEKNAKYCPQMDFVSTQYLSGVPQAEVPAWKEFFQRVGVKEQADNPYVATFAMLFVEGKMASELVDFIPKDRQKQGYDREATRSTDGSTVYIEIKGQKKHGPVELDGNEPKAATDAKKKNQPFWLCIVPGIPENPELWVIEDPISIGAYNVVTIDVSNWKMAGRRLV